MQLSGRTIFENTHNDIGAAVHLEPLPSSPRVFLAAPSWFLLALALKLSTLSSRPEGNSGGDGALDEEEARTWILAGVEWNSRQMAKRYTHILRILTVSIKVVEKVFVHPMF